MKSAECVPHDVAQIRKKIQEFLDIRTEAGHKIGNSKFGVYAFFDYDCEPIYVGQTCEMLRTRIRRHLTNQRTDAVAMNVLDPFEVAEIEIWPLLALEGKHPKDPEGAPGTPDRPLGRGGSSDASGLPRRISHRQP